MTQAATNEKELRSAVEVIRRALEKLPPAAPSTSAEKDLYYLSEVMDKLSLGRSELYEQMKSGRLRFVKVGRARRIPAAAVADFVALLEREAESETCDDFEEVA